MIEAIYIHVPFCHAKCRYCDFDSTACRDEGAYAVYADRMAACIRRLGSLGMFASVRTAYIGGGTPSVLAGHLIDIVRALRAEAPGLVELTCEANPESMRPDLVRSLARAGTTRMSIGVQSFDDAELRELGRLHTASEARAAVALALDAGLDVSIDLMCGIPLQTAASWDATLDRAIACGTGHVSVYPLTVEDGTALAARIDAGELSAPDGDFQAWCMERARARLTAAGMHPYEVASYARPGCECAHNICYWTGAGYLGLGRSAASMLDRATFDALRGELGLPGPAPSAARIRFVQTTDALPGDAVYEVEELSRAEAVCEDLMLGMRMTRGVDAELLARAREAVGAEKVDRAVEQGVARGLCAWSREGAHGRLVPTHDGWLLGNELYGLMWDLAG